MEDNQLPRKKDEHLHAKRQKEILGAAKQCFVAYGFHGTSMRQILDLAGISAGGVYNYFSGKADIVKALVEEERADIGLLIQQLESNPRPLAGIAQLVSDAIAYTAYEDAVLAAEIWAEACRNPEIKQLERVNSDLIKGALNSAISSGIRVEEITDQHKADDLAEWVLALLEGCIGRIAADKQLKPKKVARTAKLSVISFLQRSK
ncbi:MAG: TetR/AcrR family transcriptional regulator [Pseudomonadales bacterium]|nr:TetR/AcrR family transcriptional regulator [Pseudomonadales bacterium]